MRRGDQEAARRPPSIPRLSRRSGRIPALPYPPIKLSYYKKVRETGTGKIIHSGRKSGQRPGLLRPSTPSRLAPPSVYNCDHKSDSIVSFYKSDLFIVITSI